MKIYGKSLNLLAVAVCTLAVCIINCGGGNSSSGNSGSGQDGVSTCNPGNGECSQQYFEDSPFYDLDDFVNQIEQFKSEQLIVYNADIDNYTFFGDTTSALASVNSMGEFSPTVTTLNDDFVLDFLDLYIVDEDYSVVCVYKFLETSNMLDVEKYQIKSGLLLARYVYSIAEQKWVYSGESQIYRYDYLSQNMDDHRVITASFLSDESLLQTEQSMSGVNIHAMQAATSGLTLIDIGNLLNEQYVKKGIHYLRVLPDVVIQVDRFVKDTEKPGDFTTCSAVKDWRYVPHMNVRIWAYPRGDGSAEQSLGLNPRYIPLAPHLYLQWFADNKQGKHQNPGYLISNWHIGYIIENGQKCWIFAETNWPNVNETLAGKIPDTILKKWSYFAQKYGCQKKCSKKWDDIPWIPYGVPLPEPILNRIFQEINNRAPKMIPVPEWAILALGTAATPSILSALENIGPVLWSSATADSVVSGLSIAGRATLGSMSAFFMIIRVDIAFMEFYPMGIPDTMCTFELAEEGRCMLKM